jgi:hypothetical protein
MHNIEFTDPLSNLILIGLLQTKFPVKLLEKWESAVRNRELESPEFLAPIPDADYGPPLVCAFNLFEFLQFVDHETMITRTAHAVHELGANNIPGQAASKSAGNGAAGKSAGNGAAAKAAANKDKPKSAKKLAYLAKKKAAKANQPSATALVGQIAAGSASSGEKKPPQVGGSMSKTVPKGQKKKGAQKKANKKTDKARAAATPGNAKEKGPPVVHFESGCCFCGLPHAPHLCPSTQGRPHGERWRRVRYWQKSRCKGLACVKCLLQGHHESSCSKVCAIAGCGRDHHAHLHDDFIAK